MGLSVKELTNLTKETTKARHSADNLLDFADLINNDIESLGEGLVADIEKIKELADQAGKHVDNIRNLIEDELNKIPTDEEEVKDAANRLLLYHGDIHQVISWADTQKSNHRENSYWWRYWTGVLEQIMQIEVEKREQASQQPAE